MNHVLAHLAARLLTSLAALRADGAATATMILSTIAWHAL